jgi:tetratricopeptide (TPR) repeat protein
LNLFKKKKKKKMDETFKQEGNVYFKNKKFQKAILCYRKALNFNPLNARVHGNLSICYLKLLNVEKAQFHAKNATEIDPTWAKGWMRLSQAYEASDFPLCFALDSMKKASALDSIFNQELKRIQKLLDEKFFKNVKKLISNMFHRVDVGSKGYITESEYVRMMNICLRKFEFGHDFGWQSQDLQDRIMNIEDFQKFIFSLGPDGNYFMAEYMEFEEPTYKFDASNAILQSTTVNESLALLIYEFMREFWGNVYVQNFQIEWQIIDECDLSFIDDETDWIMHCLIYEIPGGIPMVSVGVEVDEELTRIGATCPPVLRPASVALWVKFFGESIKLFGLNMSNFQDI